MRILAYYYEEKNVIRMTFSVLGGWDACFAMLVAVEATAVLSGFELAFL